MAREWEASQAAAKPLLLVNLEIELVVHCGAMLARHETMFLPGILLIPW